jgi:hypothetical protein
MGNCRTLSQDSIPAGIEPVCIMSPENTMPFVSGFSDGLIIRQIQTFDLEPDDLERRSDRRRAVSCSFVLVWVVQQLSLGHDPCGRRSWQSARTRDLHAARRGLPVPTTVVYGVFSNRWVTRERGGSAGEYRYRLPRYGFTQGDLRRPCNRELLSRVTDPSGGQCSRESDCCFLSCSRDAFA